MTALLRQFCHFFLESRYHFLFLMEGGRAALGSGDIEPQLSRVRVKNVPQQVTLLAGEPSD